MACFSWTAPVSRGSNGQFQSRPKSIPFLCVMSAGIRFLLIQTKQTYNQRRRKKKRTASEKSLKSIEYKKQIRDEIRMGLVGSAQQFLYNQADPTGPKSFGLIR
jgi:hypothetical protein